MSSNEPSSVEKELKFAHDDLESLRERLGELEAERHRASAFEDNWVLDREGELLGSGCILRLRKDGLGAVVTFKGPATFEGGLKVRTEHESRVEELEHLRRIFENLGYRTVRRYQKVREEWQLGGVSIALDRTPIGDFVEFEGSGAATVARRCGFKPDQAERRTYLGIYDDHLAKHPELPRDMVFP